MAGGRTRAAVLHGALDLRMEERSIPEPAPNEIQVDVQSTGLCGSDLHYYNHFANGDMIVQEPLILGHESAGIITAIGSNVRDFEVGEKIALEVGVSCGTCERCSEGRYNLCKDMRFRSSAKSMPHFQGTLQDRLNHPAALCHKLPDDVSLDEGALLEPLSVAIHAWKRSGLGPSSKLLIIGAGAVGLLVAAVARYHGTEEILIADISQERIDFAVEHGYADAKYLVPMRRGENIDQDLAIAKDTAASLGELPNKRGKSYGQADAVFECTGVPSSVQTGIFATRPGGKLMLVGMGHPIQTLPISAAALREVDILGVFRYANTYKTAITMVSQLRGAVPDISKLITHRVQGLENVEKAFMKAGRPMDSDGKMVIKVMLRH